MSIKKIFSRSVLISLLAISLGSWGTAHAKSEVFKANGAGAYANKSFDDGSYLFAFLFSDAVKQVTQQSDLYSGNYIDIYYGNRFNSYYYGGPIPDGALTISSNIVSVNFDSCTAPGKSFPRCGIINLQWKADGRISMDHNGVFRLDDNEFDFHVRSVGGFSSSSAQFSGSIMDNDLNKPAMYGDAFIDTYRGTDILISRGPDSPDVFGPVGPGPGPVFP